VSTISLVEIVYLAEKGRIATTVPDGILAALCMILLSFYWKSPLIARLLQRYVGLIACRYRNWPTELLQQPHIILVCRSSVVIAKLLLQVFLRSGTRIAGRSRGLQNTACCHSTQPRLRPYAK